MNIADAGLKFRGKLSKRVKTNRAILHHAAASTCSPQQIHQWHLNNGWAGAGYHIFVRKDGSTYYLRPIDAIGAHASGANSDSIGVCFEGHFDKEAMPDAQRRAGQEVVAWIKSKYGISKVQKHSDVCATGCPGKNFPFEAIAGVAASSAPAQSAPAQSKPAASATPANGNPYSIGGAYSIKASELNVRSDASTSAPVVASYRAGQTVNLDSWSCAADGYVWGRYTGASSGKKRYIAVRALNGSKVYAAAQAHKPAPKPAPKPAASTAVPAGTYKVVASSGVKVRTNASTSAGVAATYSNGQTVKLDGWSGTANGWVWGRYIGASSGKYRYIAVRKADGSQTLLKKI